MNYESPLKYFRDQNKEPDKYSEGRESELNLGDFEQELPVTHFKTETKTEKDLEILGQTGEKYRQTIELIKSAGLKIEFKSDLSEQAIIENRKEAILKFLKSILDDARNYLSQVNFLQIQKMASYDSEEQYKSVIGPSDNLRRSYHNKMISDLKIAMRLININFNADFADDFRLEEEAKMTDRQGLSKGELKNKMAEREYIHFPYPTGVFIDFSEAPKDPQGEREYIAHWALNLYSDLSVLDDEIKK